MKQTESSQSPISRMTLWNASNELWICVEDRLKPWPTCKVLKHARWNTSHFQPSLCFNLTGVWCIVRYMLSLWGMFPSILVTLTWSFNVITQSISCGPAVGRADATLTDGPYLDRWSKLLGKSDAIFLCLSFFLSLTCLNSWNAWSPVHRNRT